MLIRSIGLMCVVALLLAGCGPAAPVASSPAPATAAPTVAPTVGATPGVTAVPVPATPTKVKVGVIGTYNEVGLYVAQEKGYFKELGLDVEFVKFAGGAQQVQPLATGQIDYATPSPDPAMFNAVGRGIGLKIVSPLGIVDMGSRSAALVVRKDLTTSGRYKTLADLKGMKVGVGGTAGTTGQYLVENVLKKANLTAADITVTALGYGDVTAALTNKSLDASWLVEPFLGTARDLGVAEPVAWLEDAAAKGTIVQTLAIGPNFLRDNAAAAKRFAVALLKGQREYYRAVQKNEGGKAEVVGILIKAGVAKDAGAFDRAGLTTVSPNLEVDAKILTDQRDFFVRTGQVTGNVEVTTLVDATFTQYALSQLGRL